jgi:SPX domain protein involved in polyphosphate accumulation
MRNERKFLTGHQTYQQTEDFLLSNKYPIHEIYEKRFINNVYFDTHDYQFFSTNVEGDNKRLKVRIRWYGNLHNVMKPILEYKIKNGNIVSKKNYQIEMNHLSEILDTTSFMKRISETCSDKKVAEQLLYLKPTLVNRYFRGYYSTQNEHVRLTIDEDVEFYSPDTLTLFYKEHARLLELKYAPEHEKTAELLSNTMDFRLKKNSKYVNGLSKLLWY